MNPADSADRPSKSRGEFALVVLRVRHCLSFLTSDRGRTASPPDIAHVTEVKHSQTRAGLPPIAAAAITAAVLAAGCSGSGKSYSSGAVERCLKEKNAKVSASDADYIAQSAHGFYVHGTDLVHFAANVSFGDPKRLKAAYEQIGPAKTETHGNALVVWDDYSNAGRTIVDDCFR